MKHKLSLEKITADDFSKYYTLVSNKKVMEMITQRAIPFEEAKSKYESLLNNNQLHESFGSFKIIDTETNTFIGYAKLVVKEANSNEAEVGYMLLPEFWGRGIGSEVTRMLIKKAQKLKQLQRVTAMIDPKNIASRRILIKNRFVTEKMSEVNGLPSEIFSRILVDNQLSQNKGETS